MRSPAWHEYRRQERRLIHVRWRHRGLESEEEELILEAMTDAWVGLTDEERRELDSEPPRSLIRTSSDARRRRLEFDVDVFDFDRAPVRTLGEAA